MNEIIAALLRSQLSILRVQMKHRESQYGADSWILDDDRITEKELIRQIAELEDNDLL